MKVRVKEGMSGFIYGVLRTEGKEFTLRVVEHSVDKDGKGNPVKISINSQFSDKWMEKIGGKKQKAEEPEEVEEVQETTED